MYKNSCPIFLIPVLLLLISTLSSAQKSGLDYFNLSYSKTEQKQNDSAMYYLSMAIKSDPGMVNAYYNRGLIRLNHSDLLGALEDFDKCVLLEPTYARAYNNRGYVYLMLGNAEKGCKDIRIARDYGIEQAKNNFESYCINYKE